MHSFQAYTLADIEFVETLCDSSRTASPGLITDFFGMRLDPSYEPAHAARRGEVIDRPPFPTDTVLAEGIEYAALALALRAARGRFTIIELGAGWGPWVTLGVICARRLGIQDIAISAAEADPARFGALRQHLALNGIVAQEAENKGRSDTFAWNLHNEIVWSQDGDASWPEPNLADAGRRAVQGWQATDTDYRGRHQVLRTRRTISMQAVLAPHDAIDLLHMDVQGSEFPLILSALHVLARKVRYLYIGTHSRPIEGELINLLFRRGWQLEREDPCYFRCGQDGPTLEALTLRDGGQVWRNTALAD